MQCYNDCTCRKRLTADGPQRPSPGQREKGGETEMRTSTRKPGGRRRRRRHFVCMCQRVGLALACLALLLAAALVLWNRLNARSEGGPGAAGLPDREDALCVVCIDPGHGGSDQGASWEGRLEKEDNLAVALALQRALADRNICAVLTRSEDTALTLEERVAFAQQQQADYYISLHRNYADVSACGVEIWVAEQCSDAALALARDVEEGLVSVGIQNDRGVRQGSQSGEGDYYVLSHTTMPAILIELGFLQDAEDNRLLDKHLQAYAEAIASAVATVAEGQP